MKTEHIDEEEFWSIMENCTHGLIDSWDIRNNIITHLSGYAPDEIINYECIFRRKLLQADHPNVIATADIIDGTGGSTDAFLYFRCWLITKGKLVFEAAIQDPNKLSDFIDFEEKITPSAENILYISQYAYLNSKGYGAEDRAWDEINEKLIARCPGTDYDDPTKEW